jgi:precorrin-4/cobalt-precorrin-4 C11-methyltransferase
MIIASPALGAREWPELTKSRLYDARFTHRFRRASMPPEAPSQATPGTTT